MPALRLTPAGAAATRRLPRQQGPRRLPLVAGAMRAAARVWRAAARVRRAPARAPDKALPVRAREDKAPAAAARAGFTPAPIPEEFARRQGQVTAETLAQIKQFVADGGTVIAIGSQAMAAVQQFGLPITNHLLQNGAPLGREKYYVPGAVLQIALDPALPLTHGLPANVDVFFDNDPVFKLADDARRRACVRWAGSRVPRRCGADGRGARSISTRAWRSSTRASDQGACFCSRRRSCSGRSRTARSSCSSTVCTFRWRRHSRRARLDSAIVTARRSAAFAIATTGLLFLAFRVVGWLNVSALQTPWSEGLLKVGVWALPSVAVMCLAWRQSVPSALDELGLWSNPFVGYGFAFVASLPMLVGPSRGFVPSLQTAAIAGTVLLSPFTEEILFRGLLFRQLYRHGGASLVRAMALSSIAFALAHIVPSEVRLTMWTPMAGLVSSAALVGMVLAWLTYRWDSVWPAIGLHTCLNLSWELYGKGLVGRDSLTFWTRVGSIGLAIALTIRFTQTRRAASG